MKILLLGGTEFVGRAIAEEFKKAGHDLTLFTRRLKGDRKNPADLDKVAKSTKWDLVIDNLGYTKSDMEILVKAFAGRTGRLFFTSTVSVYRYSNRRFYQPLNEEDVQYGFTPKDEDPSNVHWQYARGKLEAEAYLTSQKEIPWTIFRPSPVYGPFDNKNRVFWYLTRLIQGGPILLGNGGVQSFRLCFSEDLARAYRSAAEKDSTKNQIYYLAQFEIVTLRQLLELSAEALKAPVEFLSLPEELLGELSGPLGNLQNFIPNIAKAQHELEYRPTPFEEFCTLTAKWFRDQWKGNEKELLTTRDEELTLAHKWKNKVPPQFNG